MAGRRSKMPIEQKIIKVKDQIVSTEERLCRLKSELQELCKKRDQVKVQELYELMQESNMSIDNLKDLINNNTHTNDKVSDNNKELGAL